MLKFSFCILAALLLAGCVYMGIEIAFGGDADFSAMTAEPDGLCIGDMLQQCFAKADELGA